MRSSRAVVRPIEPGNSAMCAHCGAQVKFVARAQLRQVTANVYEAGNWLRVERFHPERYDKADQPSGVPEEKPEKHRWPRVPAVRGAPRRLRPTPAPGIRPEEVRVAGQSRLLYKTTAIDSARERRTAIRQARQRPLRRAIPTRSVGADMPPMQVGF